MFIQTEPTPNPDTLKFLPGQDVMGPGRTASFTDREATARAPLAKALFDVKGVTGVFLGSDFVTVTRHPAVDWDGLKPEVLGVIMEHAMSGLPAVEDDPEGDDDDADTDEIILQIKELLETKVRPAVAQDGGDIIFDRFEDGVVYVSMQGSCDGCPSSTATLKNGIENLLKYYVPEVRAVAAAD